MRLAEWCQRLSRPPLSVAAMVVLLWIAVEQSRTISHLKANCASAQAVLFQQQARLTRTSDMWKAEAMEWREKNGDAQPPSTPSNEDYERPAAP
jgi:hypothetical protein